MRIFKVSFLLFFVFFNLSTTADEIIQDKFGNYFLMKKDGTFEKLPPPKPGNTYVVKKKPKTLKKVKKKARVRTNIGFR